MDNNISIQKPMIVSVSRSTDIPAFYADWFFHRLEEGYSKWINPFNQKPMIIDYSETRFIVFWSKNPAPLLQYLDKLKPKKIDFYIQYTLNDYEKEHYEPNVPTLQFRIDTFKKIVDTYGKGRVVWRNDPLFLTDKVGIDDLLSRIEFVGNELKDYTEKLVFSFIDISIYKKVCINLKRKNIHYIEWDEAKMREFAAELQKLNSKWHFTLATCGEQIDLSEFNIEKNHCIDEKLILKLAYQDETLMKHLGYKIDNSEYNHAMLSDEYLQKIAKNKLPQGSIPLSHGFYAISDESKLKSLNDKGQRSACGCIKSKDIGQYNTCKHFCVYCYANDNENKVLNNFDSHVQNPKAETITGLV